MNDELKSLYSWFDIKRDEIIEGHRNERVLISDNEILGYYPEEKTAVEDAKKQGLELGNFLVQRCISKEEELQMFENIGVFYAL